ncbi:YHS domain-containing (seleno)protein [Pelagicoccus sp. SDUM812003]|uniref:YHS domain-containing (seleno)protein n=1 Tax=Pelagicoccus sp. SDUM812003 TaxID=3041267 RepID=UPI00280D5D0B|nr:YHS domain-containing (seleno)protein [Pelagicoccus sp. SDUM812003]MDQ8204893.1 YHS domain-containing (seleno)protein [Pelagicoccus sp. SDUM812003]
MKLDCGYGAIGFYLAWLFLFAAIPDRALGEDRNVAKDDGLALQGYDPVSYHTEAAPVKGRDDIVVERDGALYRFSSEEHRQAFLEDPERYEPAFGGWCAWAMLDGEKVDVDPESYRIFDGRLLVFYDGFWGATREKWTKKSQKSGEKALYEQASRNWKRVK